MNELKAGQLVRIVIEGPVKTAVIGYGAPPVLGGVHVQVGDNDIFVGDDGYPEVKVTCEVIRQPLRAGQVYETTDGKRWFIRYSTTKDALVALAQANEVGRDAEFFLASNPDAMLLLDAA